MNVLPHRNNLSPLDQIRQVEAEVTRQIAVARQAADRRLHKAQEQAKDLIEEARQTGRREGQARHREIISKAEEEAHAIISQAQNQAGELRRKGNRRMDAAVRRALNIILSLS